MADEFRPRSSRLALPTITQNRLAVLLIAVFTGLVLFAMLGLLLLALVSGDPAIRTKTADVFAHIVTAALGALVGYLAGVASGAGRQETPPTPPAK